MSILQKTVLPNINITAENTVLSYSHPASASNAIVFIRADLGDPNPIAGGGDYLMEVSVNNRPIAPVSTVTVGAGDTEATVQSREVTLESGDILSVKLTGRPADTLVSVTVLVQDATPIRQDGFDDIIADIENAFGVNPSKVLVDHNYGGADNLQYVTPTGSGIGDATIYAFTTADYNGGNRSSDYVRAVSTTDNNGRWRRQMLLDPGLYVLLYFKAGFSGPDEVSLTVTA